MQQFKISDLASFSGVKAHTIRIWEQRYNLFHPDRSTGNIRFYSLAEVRLLLDVSLLLRQGFRISSLAGRTPAAINYMVEELTGEAVPAKAINDLIVLMLTSEIEEFEDVLDSSVHVLGIDETVTSVIMPFLDRVQLLSYNNSSLQTHLVVTALRKKIIVAIESASPAAILPVTAVLYLNEKEHYDLILLYAAYILKRKGFRVVYLGTNISFQNLEQIALLKKPEILLTFIPQKHKFAKDPLVHFLKKALPDAHLIVLGCETADMEDTVENVRFMHYNQVADVD